MAGVTVYRLNNTYATANCFAHSYANPKIDAVLVPLLAFDKRGYRLGWGGGYYDRTLELLRKTGSVTAIGVAYAAQEVDAVPFDTYDQPVDWIITEQQALKIT